MLLRSSSTPILSSSRLPHSHSHSHSHSRDSSPEPESLHQIIPRTPSNSLTLSATGDFLNRKMTRAMSETDLRGLSLSLPHRKPFTRFSFNGLFVEQREEESKSSSKTASLGPALFSFSECDDGLDEGEVGNGGGRGRICGGGGGGASDNNGGGGSGNDVTDAYYQTMIEANPGNSLFLSNYARYLKEVRADYVKAEEYCGRAILANPNDGNVLSMYAELLWDSRKDASRAETYFDQAVKAAPDDCYVLASYAHFLWDAEEEDDAVGKGSSEKSPSFFHGATPPPPPLAAAS